MATETIERPVQRTATDLETLFPGRYLSVTSVKRDGTGVATPVWFVSDRQAAVRADRPALGEGPAHTPQPACPGRAVPRARQAAQRAGPGAGRGADCHPGTGTRVQKLLIKRYKTSYRLVMLFYRLGRRLRGQQSVADGAALAITID